MQTRPCRRPEPRAPDAHACAHLAGCQAQLHAGRGRVGGPLGALGRRRGAAGGRAAGRERARSALAGITVLVTAFLGLLGRRRGLRRTPARRPWRGRGRGRGPGPVRQAIDAHVQLNAVDLDHVGAGQSAAAAAAAGQQPAAGCTGAGRLRALPRPALRAREQVLARAQVHVVDLNDELDIVDLDGVIVMLDRVGGLVVQQAARGERRRGRGRAIAQLAQQVDAADIACEMPVGILCSVRQSPVPQACASCVGAYQAAC